MPMLRIIASGTAIIAAIAVFRAIFINRLPKRVFVIAWELAMLRLLIPITLELPVLPAVEPEKTVTAPAAYEDIGVPDSYIPPYAPKTEGQDIIRPQTAYSNAAAPTEASPAPVQKAKRKFPWLRIWAFGASAMGLYYLASYLYIFRKLKDSLPVENSYVKDWLFVYRRERKVSVRYSDRVNSPLTYGVFRPTIVLPKDLTCCDENRLGYILEHEFAHVKHYDALKKPIAAAVLCLNWFNPLVWLLYYLYNRDIELWCDECVLKSQGGRNIRSDYAMTLITMEELRGHSTLVSAFRKNSVEERIVSIMKFKKLTFISAIAAVLVVAAITVTIIAVSVEPVPKKAEDNPEDLSGQDMSITGPAMMMQMHYVYDENAKQGRDFLNLSKGEHVAAVYKFDREVTQEEADALSACGILNGEKVYKTVKTLAVGDMAVCLFTAPEDGEYSFSVNFDPDGSAINFTAGAFTTPEEGEDSFSVSYGTINFTAGAYLKNAEDGTFGGAAIDDSEFENAEPVEIDPAATPLPKEENTPQVNEDSDGGHLTDALPYAPDGTLDETDRLAERHMTITGPAAMMQIHDVYDENGQHGWDLLNLSKGENVAVIFELDREVSPEEAEALSACGIADGKTVYRTTKTIADGSRAISLFTAPKDGEYSFSANFGLDGVSVGFTAGAYIQSAENGEFGGAEPVEVDPSSERSYGDGDSLVNVRIYENGMGEMFYNLYTAVGGLPICLQLDPADAKNIGLDGIESGGTLTVPREDFTGWILGDGENLSAGMTCYDDVLGYVILNNTDGEYSVIEDLHNSINKIAEGLPQEKVTLEIAKKAIMDIIDFGPGDTVEVTEVRNISGARASDNGDGTWHLETGTYELIWGFDGTDRGLDYRLPVQIIYSKGGAETMLCDTTESETSALSYNPGQRVLTFNVVAEGDYRFYIKNIGDHSLPLNTLALVSIGESHNDVPYLEVK